MSPDSIILQGPHKNFEDIKKIDEDGIEYWEARELMPLLSYDKWQNSEEVIKRAIQACIRSGQVVENHFTDASKMVDIGSNTVRKVKDYKLDRYACYLIAQNGDSRKTAKAAGVTKFGLFNNAGYQGLYGMPLSAIEKKKAIQKGELLDRAGATELAANLFRVTQTDEKIKRDRITGQKSASDTHFKVGNKVRQTIKELGGAMPEELPVEKHIKEVKKEIKKLPYVSRST